MVTAGQILTGHIAESKVGSYEPRNVIVKSASFQIQKVILNIENPFFKSETKFASSVRRSSDGRWDGCMATVIGHNAFGKQEEFSAHDCSSPEFAAQDAIRSCTKEARNCLLAEIFPRSCNPMMQKCLCYPRRKEHHALIYA